MLMTVDEYLHTSFEDGDCDFLDGEVVERNIGEFPHSNALGNLSYALWKFRARLGARVLISIRIRISPTRYPCRRCRLVAR